MTRPTTLASLLLAACGLSACSSLPAWLPGASPDAAVPAVTEPASTDEAYRIGAEDVLDIAVWKEEGLRASVVVRPDGGISFPLAGDLPAAGRTAAELRGEIVQRLARYVPEPEVTVSVARAASYRIYVIGRVNKPGEIAAGRPLDVLQALAMAGGTTPFASEDAMRIVRRLAGRSTSIPFDYTRLRKGGDLSQNITLKSGDVLFVP